MRILVVEDEKKLSDNICALLKNEYYDCEQVYDGEAALDRIYEQHFDLILLDIMMPKLNGIEVLEALREADNSIAVLMLSARDQIEDRVRGLDAGADDYLPKPFSNRELLARMRSLLRRHSTTKTTKLTCKDLSMDSVNNEVMKNGECITLTAKQYKILEHFLLNQDIVFTRLQLSEYIWGEENSERSGNAIDAHLKNLRKKIGEDYIETIRSIGYIMRKKHE